MKWALLTISVLLLSNRVGFSSWCAVERVLKNRQLLFGTTGKQGMNAAEQVPAKQKPLSKSSGDPRAGALCLVLVWVLSSRNTDRPSPSGRSSVFSRASMAARGCSSRG